MKKFMKLFVFFASAGFDTEKTAAGAIGSAPPNAGVPATVPNGHVE